MRVDFPWCFLVPALALWTACSSDALDEDADLSAISGDAVIEPEADLYVSSGHDDTNFGDQSRVEVDRSDSGNTLEGYLRFQVGDVGPVERARVLLYVKNSSSDSADVVAVSDGDWGELSTTWSNKPRADGAVLGTIGRSSASDWVAVDVTASVVSGRPLSLALLPRSTDGFEVSSKEAGRAAPRLVLDLGAKPSVVCGDGACDAGEDCTGCSADCGRCAPSCGDGACDAGEDCTGCSADCGRCAPSCGDGACGSEESCASCATDCGACPPPPDPPSPPSSPCLERGSKSILSGTYTEQVSISSPPLDHAVDARTAVSLTNGERALEIGASGLAEGLCVVGWTTIGQQSRTLSWRTMHDDVGGSALRVYGSNYVVDGLRAENVEDGFDPRSGEGFELRNAWMSYLRDDCIENDQLAEGAVIDSLFDGCYTFFSEQEDGSGVGESLTFDHVLVRLQAMPAPRGTEDPSILGHGNFFKKFHYEGRHEPVIRDSIFFMERDCNEGCRDWPAGTVASNVIVVWGGSGSFPMSVLPGMTLTTDRSIWDRAVTRWKERHGCTTMDQLCTKLHNPDPY